MPIISTSEQRRARAAIELLISMGYIFNERMGYWHKKTPSCDFTVGDEVEVPTSLFNKRGVVVAVRGDRVLVTRTHPVEGKMSHWINCANIVKVEKPNEGGGTQPSPSNNAAATPKQPIKHTTTIAELQAYIDQHPHIFRDATIEFRRGMVYLDNDYLTADTVDARTVLQDKVKAITDLRGAKA